MFKLNLLCNAIRFLLLKLLEERSLTVQAVVDIRFVPANSRQENFENLISTRFVPTDHQPKISLQTCTSTPNGMRTLIHTSSGTSTVELLQTDQKDNKYREELCRTHCRHKEIRH